MRYANGYDGYAEESKRLVWFKQGMNMVLSCLWTMLGNELKNGSLENPEKWWEQYPVWSGGIDVFNQFWSDGLSDFGKASFDYWIDYYNQNKESKNEQKRKTTE